MGKKILGLCLYASSFALLCSTIGIAPALAQAPLPPATIPKYVTPLAIPSVMPMTSELPGGIKYYEVAARQLSQQILPAPLPKTAVWGYGSVSDPASFSAPGPTFEVTADTPVRVKWVNDLVAQDGNFIPHLLAGNVDQTLHWANPPQQCADGTTSTDCAGFAGTYLGPVPLITHLHGSHVAPDSDGHPEAWYLPAANDIPAGYATKGSHFGQIAGAPVEPGAAYFQYGNDQRATTLWYHDHSLGITSVNTYTGLAGFYLIRGGATDLPAGVLPGGAYEIPIAIQERSFFDDGSLNYNSPINGAGDGDTMMVNGKTWPYLNVEPRRYRFRFLNGSNNNPIHLELATDNTPDGNIDTPGDTTSLNDVFTQIGADGGFLPTPTVRRQVLLHPAERADVIVDFSSYNVGDVLYLINNGDNPANLGQVMKIVVVALTSLDTSTLVNDLVLPTFTPLGPADNTRKVSLNFSDAPGLPEHLLGTVNPDSNLGVPLLWMDAITESPRLDSTEIWEIHNFSAMEHPIHLHQVQFEIIDRRPLGTSVGDPSTTGPGPGETGTKDTVIVGDDQITRVKAKFDIPGLFVWHCHILIHEDDEMMRPFYVAGLTVPDALRALQIAVGTVTANADDLRYLDLAPLVGGVSTPDGKIDITDALLVLRRAIGLNDV